jgi:peroxiredoxin
MLHRLLTISVLIAGTVLAQGTPIVWSDREKPIYDQIRTLRSVPDNKRGAVTKQLALDIRQLPLTNNKVTLAGSLADLSTEGDFGHDTLQEVATALSETLREEAAVSTEGMPEEPYITLAQLVRYEHVQVPSSPLLATATTRLQMEEQKRQKADFTLKDLQGRQWTLSQLRGKVVLVNFWATWCPPCRKEMPDLDALYAEFKEKGLVILAISDEDPGKVQPFIAEHKYSYPILLDPGDKVTKLMAVEGIPRSFVYDREGKLVAQAMDMRTRGQLLEMLSQAGLK